VLDGGGGGGSGGHFVGLQPANALGLATTMVTQGSQGAWTSARIALMLAEAGPEGGGCAAPVVLRNMDRWLDTAATDVRWRVELVAADAAGTRMVYGYVPFRSAAAAAAAGRRHARLIAAAEERLWAADGDDEAAAEAEYFALLRAIEEYAHDPAWAGGLLDRLGTEGISVALYLAGTSVEGELQSLREIVGPLFTALATGMTHGTADPSIRQDLLRWPTWDLALFVALAPADTGFLTQVARRILISSLYDGDMATNPTEREYELVLGALADNSEASYRVLTGSTRYGPAITDLMWQHRIFASDEAGQALGRVLEAGLVDHPASHGVHEWNAATTATEHLMAAVAQQVNLYDDVPPELNASLASVLRPHLDAVAVIGARAAGSNPPGRLDVPLPGGRRALDVDAETVRRYLGAVMQQDAGITHVQLLLAAYTQSPAVQANRLPLLADNLGDITELDAFATDSARIAGLLGLVGGGMDVAGHDEESLTRFLVGAMNLATGKGASALIPAKMPAAWFAQQGAKYLAGQLVDEAEEWLQSREPIEGEAGVDSFLESYTEVTIASLREHIDADPRLSALSTGEQDALLRSAQWWVEHSVSGPLRLPYADLVAETAREG
jgi:hypothetical protein